MRLHWTHSKATASSTGQERPTRTVGPENTPATHHDSSAVLGSSSRILTRQEPFLLEFWDMSRHGPCRSVSRSRPAFPLSLFIPEANPNLPTLMCTIVVGYSPSRGSRRQYVVSYPGASPKCPSLVRVPDSHASRSGRETANPFFDCWAGKSANPLCSRQNPTHFLARLSQPPAFLKSKLLMVCKLLVCPGVLAVGKVREGPARGAIQVHLLAYRRVPPLSSLSLYHHDSENHGVQRGLPPSSQR